MANPTPPVLIYDGKCGFCRIWIGYWKSLTGDAITYAASQDVAASYPHIPMAAFSESVQLVLPSGEVLSGARAVFQTLAVSPSREWIVRAYENLPGLARISEAAYRLIAKHRSFFYWVTVLLYGRKVERLRFNTVEAVFVRLLGAIYFSAFVSFGVQASALIGSRGVEPVALYSRRAQELLGEGKWLGAPTLLWVDHSDAFLRAIWVCGAVFSIMVALGIFWRGALLIAFLCYLSLLHGSQEFLSYQWDILLLEAGFLSLFIGHSRATVWLFRWLLFRLMFLSGAVKLLGHDPTWRNLTALTVHFETQPIPTPLSWYAHQLPAPALKAACFATLFIELAIPFLVLGPRRVRLFAAGWLIGLQGLILLTGNYAFFNWLALALCLFLFDDAQLERVMSARWVRILSLSRRVWMPRSVRRILTLVGCGAIALLSTLVTARALGIHLPRAARALISAAAPSGITSSYGLFARMTTVRPEIVIEGSNDGVDWLEYEFRYKPGRPDRRPPWVAPHQPRLDWQMWFAALGSYHQNVWFLNLLARLLQNERDVLAQFERNPFPDAAPKLVRARMYQYNFSDWQTRRETGNWWTRTPHGFYVPPVSLDDLSRLPLLNAQ